MARIEEAATAPMTDAELLAYLDELPLDDEPLDADDLTAIAEGRAAQARGETIPAKVVKARLLAGSSATPTAAP